MPTPVIAPDAIGSPVYTASNSAGMLVDLALAVPIAPEFPICPRRFPSAATTPSITLERNGVSTALPVVAGDSLEAAVFATEELEETAKLYLLLRGLNPRFLSPQQVSDLAKR